MHRHRILLIEDEAELAQQLGEAEEHLASFQPCAVVTDLTLPDVPREDVVSRLRNHVGGSPIILMSAIAASELRRTAEEQGAQGAISKPFELDEFEQAVRFDCPETETHVEA